MALLVKNGIRKFKLSDDNDAIVLDDPNGTFSNEEVKKFYSSQYPEITNASIAGPEIVNDEFVYTFNKSIGTKG